MSFNLDELMEILPKKKYIQVPFDMPRAQIESAVGAFFKFLDEPEEVKRHIDYNITKHHRRGDIGFRHRDPGEDVYNDSKDFFHFHPGIFKKYPDFIENHPVVRDFLLQVQPIWDLAADTVYKILAPFDTRFPGATDKIFAKEPVHIMLRFLKYNWQESGHYLAKPHFDAGAFTLGIAESSPGLRIGSCPDDLELVEHENGKAVFMISSNYRNVLDTEELKPGWHDVIQLDQTMIGKPFARWAVVVFIEAHGVQALPRSETHKWYPVEGA